MAKVRIHGATQEVFVHEEQPALAGAEPAGLRRCAPSHQAATNGPNSRAKMIHVLRHSQRGRWVVVGDVHAGQVDGPGLFRREHSFHICCSASEWTRINSRIATRRAFLRAAEVCQ
jgi:hypothetical protein